MDVVTGDVHHFNSLEIWVVFIAIYEQVICPVYTIEASFLIRFDQIECLLRLGGHWVKLRIVFVSAFVVGYHLLICYTICLPKYSNEPLYIVWVILVLTVQISFNREGHSEVCLVKVETVSCGIVAWNCQC